MFDHGPGAGVSGDPAREINLYSPVRSMNSVASAKARSVKGSNVESVRVANDIVNMLLGMSVRLFTDGKKKFVTYFKA